MERNLPRAGELYRHFKGNLYQIIGLAKDSETGETMVVYQALYGSYTWYVRVLSEFLSQVDKEKYPDASQKYRFELVTAENVQKKTESIHKGEAPVQKEVQIVRTKEEAASEPQKREADSSEERVREEIMRFLDAEGAEGKLKVLREIRMDLDAELITTMELSLDLLPDEKESMERRIDLIERTLEKRVKFEGGRLR